MLPGLADRFKLVMLTKTHAESSGCGSPVAGSRRGHGMDAERFGNNDEEQLAFATEQGCVLYTFNVADFHRLHMQWRSAGREHAGMILAPQQRFPIGEQLRRILRLRAAITRADMRKQAEFLSNWG